MVTVSEKTSKNIYLFVHRELNPSVMDVIWRLAFTLSFGGVLSLFFCGQFGIGFSSMAKGWNHLVHVHVGATQCAIICGGIFSVFPVLLLRLLTSGILFRKIIRHYGLIQGVMILVAGFTMYFGGSFMNELINIGVWSFSAFVSFKLVGFVVDEFAGFMERPISGKV